MKLLVFAHTPPPHHGQSYMVQLMLSGLGGDHRKPGAPPVESPAPTEGPLRNIECYHINARLSRKLEDIGDLRIGKLFLLLGYCVQAIWCRFRYGVSNFYYIPAPGKRSAVYRDWLVMFLCRPFFKRVIFHWHGSGLAKWLETIVQVRSRSITYRLMKKADLSIVLSDAGRSDAQKQLPVRIAVVGNGIPDPCPDFVRSVLPRRQARVAARRMLCARRELPAELGQAAGEKPQELKVLFLGHCTEDKGLFDAVQGAILAHEELASAGSPISLKLVVAGQFVHAAEEAEFHRLRAAAGRETVEYVGFVAGEKKRLLFEQADLFCFPSHLESFGLVLVEAMAFGLPCVTTRCGAIPEVMSPDYPGLVEVRSAQQIATVLLRLMYEEPFAALRRRFEERFTVERYLANLAAALHSVEQEDCPQAQAPAIVPANSNV
jgi:glycosyltransferase involved in cell wall biosynthesis